jgi:AmiR/NasT family two-component response regulator
MWGHFNKIEKRGWYEVAAAEAKLADHLADVWKVEIDRLKAEMATMVKRKHYNDAIKSLSMCQNQIETMALELTRIQPHNRVAADAFIVLGLLEAMINLNPDMQTEEWKADQKVKQDARDAKYRVAEEKRREAFKAVLWKDDNTKYNNDLAVAVGKDYKP